MNALPPRNSLSALISLAVFSCSLPLITGCHRPVDQAVYAVAAQNQNEIDALKAHQKQLQENQRIIIAQLEELKKNQRTRRPARRPGPDADTVYAYPLELGQVQMHGKDDALVTIVAISEFQCPYCNRVRNSLEQVIAKYGESVRILFSHNPLSFHKRALPAAIAAECARDQGKFTAMHDMLFDNQRDLEDQDIHDYARQIGLQQERFKTCYQTQNHKDRLMAQKRVSTEFGARGTPAFFINGRFLSGAQPFTAFEKLIDEVLATAQSSGVRAADYYEQEILAKGKASL